MRKKALIEAQKKQIEIQNEIIKNTMDIFKILVEGGELAVHVYKDKDPACFVRSSNAQNKTFSFSNKIYEGLLSRGLIVWKSDVLMEDFVVQHYVLRIVKPPKMEE